MAGVGNPADMSDFPRLSSGPFTRRAWPPLIGGSVFADCFRCICLMDFPAFPPGLLAGVLKPPQHGLQTAFSLLLFHFPLLLSSSATQSILEDMFSYILTPRFRVTRQKQLFPPPSSLLPAFSRDLTFVNLHLRSSSTSSAPNSSFPPGLRGS